ncbi:DUF4287 domain-containing protein [Blastococcus sp. DSM 46786]|uniref:DUF4287 domain-containing protein n=1 Tax=Blastococcus sp. DSM 46786 TaxID=1798227 RepID=UPI001B8C371F|nr:DUF4287 domain-containing protein [Blastococcus sp. DSM 46786]
MRTDPTDPSQPPEAHMSFQAYLDAAEQKTGRTPQELVALATARGFGPGTKAGPILAWLKDDFSLGRGHGMALVHVITKGPVISDAHVGTSGSHRDESAVLRLDGIAARAGDA